jgi:hypothetical protein
MSDEKKTEAHSSLIAHYLRLLITHHSSLFTDYHG